MTCRQLLKNFAVVMLTLWGLLDSSARADIINPVGLNPGDQYRIAFITNGGTSSFSNDIEFYNTFISNQAAIAGSETARLTSAIWKAIGSTASVDARVNTQTDTGVGVPIFLVDGITLVASDYGDLWDGLEANEQIDLDQFGNSRISEAIRTGSAANGTGFSPNQLGSGSLNTVTGSNVYSPPFLHLWITGNTAGHGGLAPMYGLSDVLTVSAVPEPSSLLLLTGASVTLLAFKRRLPNVR